MAETHLNPCKTIRADGRRLRKYSLRFVAGDLSWLSESLIIRRLTKELQKIILKDILDLVSVEGQSGFKFEIKRLVECLKVPALK